MSKNGTIMTGCLHCGQWKLHHARGLCKCCYNHAAERGYLHLYPPLGGCGLGAVQIGPEAGQKLASMGRRGLHPWMQGGKAA